MRTTILAMLALALLTLTTVVAFGQPVEEWNHTFGGPGSDLCADVKETSDDGYIITGWSDSYGIGKYDFWLIKTDLYGNELWNHTFGGSEDDIGGYSVDETEDGGYVIVGGTKSYGAGDMDIWLIKTDHDGIWEWDKTFGGPDFDLGNVVQQTDEGGYIVAGTTNSFGSGSGDLWLIKTDSYGNELWNHTLGEENLDSARSMVQSSKDGCYVFVGPTRSYGSDESDVWMVKVDSKGVEQWNRTFGGIDIDEGRAIQQTYDDGYIIAGKTKSHGAGDFDLWLIKTDPDGNEEWNRTFGGSEWDDGFSVATVEDGGYLVAGSTRSYVQNPGQSKTWLIKTDGLGDEQWNQTFTGDIGGSMYRTKDGGCVIGSSEFISTSSVGTNVTLIKLIW